MPGPVPPPTPEVPPVVNLPAGATSEPPVSITEKVIGAGITAVPNMATASWAGPEVNGIAGLLNIALEQTKNIKAFPEQMTPWVMIAASLGIGWWLWSQDMIQAVSKGAWIATQTHSNWIGGKRLGLLNPTAPENRHGG